MILTVVYKHRIGVNCKKQYRRVLQQVLWLMVVLMSFSMQAKSCEYTMRLGIGEHWPPYVHVDGQIPYGSDIAVVQYLFSQLDICLTFVKMPSSSRGIAALNKGNIDFLLAVSYNKEREKIGWFSKPYRHENIRIFWRPKGQNVRANCTLEQLLKAEMRGALNRGSFAGQDLEDLKSHYLKNNQLIEASTLSQRMGMLMRGRVDFTIEDQWAGLYHIETQQLGGVELHPYVVFSDEVSLLFSRKTVAQAFVVGIDDLLKQHQQQITKILREHSVF